MYAYYENGNKWLEATRSDGKLVDYKGWHEDGTPITDPEKIKEVWRRYLDQKK
jgi:hypothetical protein